MHVVQTHNKDWLSPYIKHSQTCSKMYTLIKAFLNISTTLSIKTNKLNKNYMYMCILVTWRTMSWTPALCGTQPLQIRNSFQNKHLNIYPSDTLKMKNFKEQNNSFLV